MSGSRVDGRLRELADEGCVNEVRLALVTSMLGVLIGLLVCRPRSYTRSRSKIAGRPKGEGVPDAPAQKTAISPPPPERRKEKQEQPLGYYCTGEKREGGTHERDLELGDTNRQPLVYLALRTSSSTRACSRYLHLTLATPQRPSSDLRPSPFLSSQSLNVPAHPRRSAAAPRTRSNRARLVATRQHLATPARQPSPSLRRAATPSATLLPAPPRTQSSSLVPSPTRLKAVGLLHQGIRHLERSSG